MAYQGSDFEPALKVTGLVCVLVGIATFIALRSPAQADPPISWAFGCYVTDAAPAIELGPKGMRIHQPRFAPIGFHLERQKTGIVLTAEAPIFAHPDEGRYVYGVSDRGIGWFMPFFNMTNGKRYGAFDESSLSHFTVLAEDGNHLIYVKATPDLCADPASGVSHITPPAKSS